MGYNNGGKELRNDFNKRDAGAGYLLAIAALLVPQFILAVVWEIGQKQGGWRTIAEIQAESFAFLIISGVALQLILGLTYFLFVRKRRIAPLRAPRVVNMPAMNWLLSAAAGVIALFGLMFTAFAFDIFFTDVLKYKEPLMPDIDNAGKAVLGVIFLGVFPSVFEELIFRGIILRGLAPLGRTKAVLISAAAFSLAHMSPAQTVHQFLIGIVMGLIAWETGSILAPMLIHFINNALAVVLEVSGFIALMEKMKVWEIVVAALVTFAAVCGIMYFILRHIKKPPQDKNEQYAFIPDGNIPAQAKKLSSDKPALMFLLSGFAVAALLWILAMFA
jgi:membrane protease YdiL (CAAX protease family)